MLEHGLTSTRIRLGLLAVSAVAIAYGVMAQGDGWNQNSHYASVRALSDGTPTIDRTRYETGDWYFTGDISLYHGHTYSNKAPGFAFALFPAYEVMKAVGKADRAHDITGQLWFLGLWGLVVPALVLLLLVRRVADDIEPGCGTAAAVALGIGTLLLPFSTLLFSHVFSAALGFAAFAVLWLERRGPPRPAWVAGAGALAGYAITTEFPNAITAGLLGVYVLARSGWLERGLAYAGGAIAGLIPLLLYNQWAFGSPFHISYQSTVGFGPTGSLFLHAPRFRQLVEVLFAKVGLMTETPILALSVIGIVMLYRRGFRQEALLFGGIAVAYLLFEASYEAPFGGKSPGPRQLIPVLPFLAVPLATVFRRLPLTTLALAGPSAVLMTAATASHPMIDFEGQWFQRLGAHDYSATVLSLFGEIPLDAEKLPSSVHWYPLLLLFVPVIAAVLLVAAERPPVRLSASDAIAGAVCLAGWFVVQREAPRWLAGQGVNKGAAPVVVLLLVLAVATVAFLLPAVFRGESAAGSSRTT